jgi:hypothetical protein
MKRLFKTILPMFLLVVMASSVASRGDDEHAEVGISKAMLSGIKGVCNGDPVSYMIRQHPELLKHKRDLTLRKGVRTSKYSLQGCVECHAGKKEEDIYSKSSIENYHPVNAEGQFCSDCHEKVGVSLDCFECHRTLPVPVEKPKFIETKVENTTKVEVLTKTINNGAIDE